MHVTEASEMTVGEKSKALQKNSARLEVAMQVNHIKRGPKAL